MREDTVHPAFVRDCLPGMVRLATALTGYGDSDRKLLAEASGTLSTWGGMVAREAVDKLFSLPDIRRLFETLGVGRDRHEAVFRRWYEQMVTSPVKDDCWEGCLPLLLTHLPHGVRGFQLQSLIAVVQSVVLKHCTATYADAGAEKLSGALIRYFGTYTAVVLEAMHLQHLLAMQVAGLNPSLISRMIFLEVRDLLPGHGKNA